MGFAIAGIRLQKHFILLLYRLVPEADWCNSITYGYTISPRYYLRYLPYYMAIPKHLSVMQVKAPDRKRVVEPATNHSAWRFSFSLFSHIKAGLYSLLGFFGNATIGGHVQTPSRPQSWTPITTNLRAQIPGTQPRFPLRK